MCCMCFLMMHAPSNAWPINTAVSMVKMNAWINATNTSMK